MINTRKVSINWIADRLEVNISNYMNQFYVFEVNKELKNTIISWADGGELDQTVQDRLKNAFQTVISIDPKINSIELVNLYTGESLMALRSGTVIIDQQDEQAIWRERNPLLQNNLFFMKDKQEILVIHQINQFEINEPKALMIIHLKTEALGEFLKKIKSSEEESVVLLNNRNQVIQMNGGQGKHPTTEKVLALLNHLKVSEKGDFIESDDYFYFFNSVNDSKLQVIQIVPNTMKKHAVQQTLLLSSLIVFLTFIVAILFSFLFSRIISKPIIQLSKQMQTVTLDSVSNFKAIHRQDEIGFLQNSFYSGRRKSYL